MFMLNTPKSTSVDGYLKRCLVCYLAQVYNKVIMQYITETLCASTTLRAILHSIAEM